MRLKNVYRTIFFFLILGFFVMLGSDSAPRNVPNVQAAAEGVGSTYPRPILYGSLNSAGTPLIDQNGDIDQAAVAAMARFPVVILPPTPLGDMHPELMTALRAANPKIQILAYTLGHDTFCTPVYTANVYYRQYWELVEAFDNDADPYCNPADTVTTGGTGGGFLWWHNGTRGSSTVNLAHRVSDGVGGWRYDLAEGLGTLMANTALEDHFDGIFLDVYCPDILWQETGQLKYDYQRAGYGTNNADNANRVAFQQGWLSGHAALTTAIRGIIPDPNFVIGGNCAQSPAAVRGVVNGWMQENFPNQNGGTWFTNMYGSANQFGGYFADEYLYLAPQRNYIFTGFTYQSGNPDEWKSSLQQQRMRFGLASASLGNGFAAFGDFAAHAYTAPYHTWWADEYGVDLPTGTSSTSPSNTGWLGSATSEAYQMINASGNPNLVTNPEVETNTTGWNFSSTAGSIASMSRVLESGDYAMQTTITQLGSVDYAVNINSSSTFSITNGVPTTITLWAKASKPRPINLILYKPGFEYGHQSFTLSTTWKQYQFTITPNQSVADAVFRIDLGQETGVVTLDSLQVQAGNGQNLYRRNFRNGIILLNATSAPVTMTLEKSWKKIIGTVNPTLNNGASVSSVTLQSNDAIFLLDIDQTSPSAVNNLTAD